MWRWITSSLSSCFFFFYSWIQGVRRYLECNNWTTWTASGQRWGPVNNWKSPASLGQAVFLLLGSIAGCCHVQVTWHRGMHVTGVSTVWWLLTVKGYVFKSLSIQYSHACLCIATVFVPCNNWLHIVWLTDFPFVAYRSCMRSLLRPLTTNLYTWIDSTTHCPRQLLSQIGSCTRVRQ